MSGRAGRAGQGQGRAGRGGAGQSGRSGAGQGGAEQSRGHVADVRCVFTSQLGYEGGNMHRVP